MRLRPYQRNFIDAILAAFRRQESFVLAVAATGAGKTIIFSQLIREAVAEWGIKVLIMAHRSEIIQQAHDKLKTVAPDLDVGIYCAGLNQKDQRQITIASRQSIVNAELDFFNLIIIDEVHNLPPKDQNSQYKTILDKAAHSRLRVLGVTATPWRMSGPIYGGNAWFDQITCRIGTQELVDTGYLCKYRYMVADGQLEKDLRSIPKSGGEYNASELAETMMREVHMGSALKALPPDRKAIVVFAVDIDHAEKLADLLGGVAVHSKMDRAPVLAAFDRGEIRILVSVGVLTEGWDSPRVDCIMMCRPTCSPALYVQMPGRGLRLYGDKDCLIIDLADNYGKHGHFTDPDIAEGKEKRRKERSERICPECGEVIMGPVCSCGFNLAEAQEKKRIDEEVRLLEVGLPAYITEAKTRYHDSAKGNRCLHVRLQVAYQNQKRLVDHYYKLDMPFLNQRLASILRKYGYSLKWVSVNNFKKRIESVEWPKKTKVKKVGEYLRCVGW